MKKIILMAGLLAMGSMYVAADEQSEVDKQREAIDAANAWAQSLEARSLAVLTDEDFNKLPEYTRMTLSKKLKDVYFAHPKNIEALPEKLHRFLQLSVQDLIDYNRVPAFENMFGSLYLDLSEKNLKSLEGLQNIPKIKTVQRLWLNKNQLTTLPAGIFNGLTALQRLKLNNNQLRTLPKGVFNDLTSLQRLELDDNKLTTLQPGVFNGLTALQELDLNKNQLTTLPENIFDNLTALEDLFLKNNQLSELPAGVFNGLTALQWLSLPDNRLTTLPAGVFNRLTALRSLRLENNQLTTLPAGIFNGLTSLQGLHLSDNRLSDEQVGAIRTALQRRYISLMIDNQRPPVEDESALAGSSTGSEMADDQQPSVEAMVDYNSPSQASSSTTSSGSSDRKRTRGERRDQEADEDRNNNGKRQK